jgi:hypothetical protein
MPLKLGMGDIIRLKKKHPCGGFHWEITRTGIDIGLKCLSILSFVSVNFSGVVR